jgi:cell wall-associated NlpC family hydrolase
MSIEAVVGRVQQILQMEQQLTDPAAANAAVSSTGVSSAGTTSASGGASFSNALASAQLGSTASAASAASAGSVSSAGSAGSASPAASVSDPRVQAMINEANSLLGKPYVYGGGHGGWAPSSGYDCSGFVSAVLHAGGYLSSPVDTTALPSQPGILSGPGQYVTIYDRDLPGESGHVIIEINGQFYESGGSAGAWGGGGGVEKIGRPSDSYLASFDRILHPAGL